MVRRGDLDFQGWRFSSSRMEFYRRPVGDTLHMLGPLQSPNCYPLIAAGTSFTPCRSNADGRIYVDHLRARPPGLIRTALREHARIRQASFVLFACILIGAGNAIRLLARYARKAVSRRKCGSSIC